MSFINMAGMDPEDPQRIADACCYITVFVGDEKVSDGTGFAYTASGEVLTAAHVVTGRWPIRHEDYNDPDQAIYCKFSGMPVAEYRVFFCGIDLEVPAFTGRIQLDLAILLPKQPPAVAVPYIPANVNPPKLGERVYMAGFSEEVELPFNVDRLLQHDFPGASEFREAMRTGYMADMSGPLIKQGIVGNLRRIVAENSQSGDHIACDVMYIDNAMHYGASGGPVVNGLGEAVAVVSQRAVTRVDVGEEKVRVPSGCTLAISLAPLLHIVRKTSGGAA
jgi:hypothetical protein